MLMDGPLSDSSSDVGSELLCLNSPASLGVHGWLLITELSMIMAWFRCAEALGVGGSLCTAAWRTAATSIVLRLSCLLLVLASLKRRIGVTSAEKGEAGHSGAACGGASGSSAAVPNGSTRCWAAAASAGVELAPVGDWNNVDGNNEHVDLEVAEPTGDGNKLLGGGCLPRRFAGTPGHAAVRHAVLAASLGVCMAAALVGRAVTATIAGTSPTTGRAATVADTGPLVV